MTETEKENARKYDPYKEMGGYIPKYGFQCLNDTITRLEAESAFQLDPEPPEMSSINEYIVMANREKKLLYLCFYLHHIEKILNRRIYRFFHREGIYGYDPRRLLDYKLNCVEAIADCMSGYSPEKGTDFLTYAHYDIGNAILNSRRYEESGSFKNLDEYKTVRGIAWLYSAAGGSREKAVAAFRKKTGCSEKTAENYLISAHKNRSHVSIYDTALTTNGEDVDEDFSRDDSWDHGTFLWNGVCANAVERAHSKLNYREQILLERRNAVCMDCGHVKPWGNRPGWEDLAILFEGSTASGAEHAYKKAVLHLAQHLVDDGLFHIIRLKRKNQKSKKGKIAAAVYEYQADCDGEWGEIHFDFENGTAELIRLADWDKTVSQPFAKYAVSYILNCKNENLPKEKMICFDR